MSEPLKIELTLDLDQHLMGATRYDGDGEPIGSEPTTLEDVVLDRVAAMLLAQLSRDEVRQELRRRVSTIRDEEIHEAVRPIIAEAMAGDIPLTNTYGEPTGRTTTLREVIVEKSMAWLTKPSSQFGHGKGSPLQNLIAEQVDRTFKNELGEELKKAKGQVVAAVRQKGTEMFSDTLARLSA